jgi:hypothetical protein
VGQEPQDSNFKVSDRRRFSPEGEPLDDMESPAKRSAEGSADASGQTAEQDVPSAASAGGGAGHRYERMSLPEASFELLVASLGMQARMELGPGDDDEEGLPPGLDLARHTIDLLAVLQEKTKGNLRLEESRLLENTLTELRFRYVQRVEEINQRAKT